MVIVPLVGCGFALGAGASQRATPEAQVRVSPSGDDRSCARGAGRAACRTWERAYTLAQAGDTISVAGGAYDGATISGSKPVTFRVAPGETASFRRTLLLNNAQKVTIYGPIDTAPAYDLNHDFYGLKTDGCSSELEFHDISGRTFDVDGSADDIRIYGGSWGGYTVTPQAGDSVIAGVGPDHPDACGDGGVVRNVVVDGVRFHDVLYTDSSTWGGAHPDCLESYGFTDGVTIRNSVFERCGNTFIGWYTDVGSNANLLVENNLFRDVTKSTYYALQIGNRAPYSCNVVFRYNTFDPNNAEAAYSQAPPLITCAGAGNTQVYGNIFRAGPPGGCDGQWSYNVFETAANACGTNARVVKDAFFVARGTNYHLRPGSPAIGRGDPNRFPGHDADGQQRPVDGAPDAGYDESRGIVAPETAKLLEQVRGDLARTGAQTASMIGPVCGTTSASSLADSLEPVRGRLPTDPCRFAVASAAGWAFISASRIGAIADPPSERRFHVVAQPRERRIRDLTGKTATAKSLAAALNAETKNVVATAELLGALATSIGRAQAAGNAGDAGSQDKQLAAARAYAKQASDALAREPALRRSVANSLRRVGLRLTSANARAAVGAARGSLRPGERRALTLLGLRPSEINALIKSTRGLRASDMAGASFPNVLTERETLARLRAAATALRRLAAGD